MPRPHRDTLRRVAAGPSWPLHDVAGCRSIEAAALAAHPPGTLMQRAGMAVARLALALAPHAQCIWVAAGPGNNGGDGIEAAAILRGWGKTVCITWLGSEATASADTLAALQRARAAAVPFADEPPPEADFGIDALLGIGATRPPDGRMAQWVAHMNTTALPVLAVDLPTGLNADTGAAADPTVRAAATLCLLTLKPGLFTADGRDAGGTVWLDTLGVDAAAAAAPPVAPCASLAGAPAARPLRHASHKGSFGDVAVLGGAPGMVGAAVLAGTAALHCGAGRVYVGLLDNTPLPLAGLEAGLMLRRATTLPLTRASVVCGCGGGQAVRAHLPRVLSTAETLVLDADALNAVADDAALQGLLEARRQRGWRTVLTPHPLEASRLLSVTAAAVQGNRLGSARHLSMRFGCTVVLKGSGTIVAAPDEIRVVNPTGNPRLATAGTGDVLAGAIGAALAAGLPAFQAACEAVFLHGLVADRWPQGSALTASLLAAALSLDAAAARP